MNKHKFSPGDEVIAYFESNYPTKATVISTWLSGRVHIQLEAHSTAAFESELEHSHVFYSPLCQALK